MRAQQTCQHEAGEQERREHDERRWDRSKDRNLDARERCVKEEDPEGLSGFTVR